MLNAVSMLSARYFNFRNPDFGGKNAPYYYALSAFVFRRKEVQ